jgi:hypothetical protein
MYRKTLLKGLCIFSLTFILGVTVQNVFPPNLQITNQQKIICAKAQKVNQSYDERMIKVPCEIDEKIYFVEKIKD